MTLIDPKRQPLLRILAISAAATLSSVGLALDQANIASTTLAPFSKSENDQLFTEIPLEQNGTAPFRNDYSSPTFWTERWHEYLHGAAGTGIAIGDLNGDGLPDFYAVSKDGQSKLFLNRGDFRFEDATADAGLIDVEGFATSVSFADVDNDGDLDIYLCFVRSPNQLWLNDGHARFTEVAEAWGVAVNSGGNIAAFADYDRDGDLDFYLQNNLIQEGTQQIPQADKLFRNERTHFVEVTESAGIEGLANGHAVTWWDFDDDGWPDLYVSNDYMPEDKLYRNNRDGTFTDVIDTTFPLTPFSSMGADFGDINNDGLWDFWATDMESADRAKHLQTAGDLVISHSQAKRGTAFQYEKNALLLQVAPRRFLDTAYLSGLARTDWTWSSRLADLDNDGWIDAFTTNGMVRKLHYKDMGARGLRISSPYRMAILFKNGEPLKEQNYAFRNGRDLTFENVSSKWGLDKLGVSFGAAFGDLDGDGDLDLIVNNFQEPLSLHRNDEHNSSRLTLELRGRQSNRLGIGSKVVARAGDLTQTKALYLTRGYLSSDQPILHFGLGSASSVDQLEVFWPSGAYQVFHDLEANRHYVIVEADQTPPQHAEPSTLFSLATFKLSDSAEREESYFNEFREQPLLPFSESRLGGDVAIGDLNGDGLNDIALSGPVGQPAALLVNNGSGAFSALNAFDLEDDFFSEETAIQFADIDGDGDLDVVIASGGIEMPAGDDSYSDKLYLNDNGTLLRHWDWELSVPRTATRALAIADYDGDGDLDIFAAGATVPGKYPHTYDNVLWSRESDGYRALPSEKLAGLATAGRISDAVWADMDADGDLELVTAQEWGPLAIWSIEDGAFHRREFNGLKQNGLWTSLAIADFDQDGRLDILAGNLGTNSPYQTLPVRLWYTANATDAVRLIETEVIDGKDWPRLEKWRMDQAFPEKKSLFESNERYAQLSLAEIFTASELQAYRSLEIDALQTGIFWQNESGDFDFSPLPPFVQSGRAMDVVIADFDGDGWPDCVFSLQPRFPDIWSGNVERGHLALVLNRGDRKFESLLPHQSGLVIDGSPRKIALGDLDGDELQELVVYLLSGKPAIFHTNAASFF